MKIKLNNREVRKTEQRSKGMLKKWERGERGEGERERRTEEKEKCAWKQPEMKNKMIVETVIDIE